MQRIVIIGTSCSGKTTLAKEISAKLNIKHIELDELHWKPQWVERKDADFIKLVKTEVKDKNWIADGNYPVIRDVLWSRSTTIIWLNYSFKTVLFRAISRSFKRSITKEIIFSGNRENFKHSFLSKESIILWVFKTHNKNKVIYSKLLNNEYTQKQIIKLNSQEETNQFLSELSS